MQRNNKRSWNQSNSYHNSNNNNNNNHNNYNNHRPNTYNEPQIKRQRTEYNMLNTFDLTQLSAPSSDQKMIAAHYGNRTDGQLEQREQSSIIQLRKINNWVKSVLISQFCHQKSIVLDIGGGKGGDLNKWAYQKIDELVHCDHAIGSIVDCKGRYNESLAKNRFNFRLKLVCADAFARQISDSLDKNIYFDIVSSQFALHYAFETEQRVKAMLLNVTQRLREDGHFIGTIPDANVLVAKWRAKSPNIHTFGNTKYRATFKCDCDEMNKKKIGINRPNGPYAIRYMFNLNDAVDCPEYLLHFDSFVELASKEPYNLELVLDCNFHEFFARNMQQKEYRKLLSKIGLLDGYGSGRIHSDQWDIAYLYKVFVFKKKRITNRVYPVREATMATELTDDDIIVCQ
eukprot:158947_1